MLTNNTARFGQYHHLRTLSAKDPADKINGTVTVGLSKPSPRWEVATTNPAIELRTFWDAKRQTLVTQALPLVAHQQLLGERYIDANGQLQQLLSDTLPSQAKIRLQQDMQLQETEHYVRTNRFAFMVPLQRWWHQQAIGRANKREYNTIMVPKDAITQVEVSPRR
jgi:hypothetical protein